MEIVCPSGLKGIIRPMRVKELGLLTDAKMMRTGQLMTKMVESCWVETLDPGPYNFVPGKQKLPWGSMLQADRLFTFKEIRVATYGPEYEQEVVCEHDGCGKKFVAVVDLTLLTVTRLPASSVAHVRENAPLIAQANGVSIQYRLLRGDDDRKLTIYMQEKDIPISTAGYICRIVDVPGIDCNVVEDLRDWFDGLDVETGTDLMDAMDRAEPTVSPRATVTCPKCEGAFDIIVPLTQTYTMGRRKKPSALPKTDAPSSTTSSSPSGIPSKMEAPQT